MAVPGWAIVSGHLPQPSDSLVHPCGETSPVRVSDTFPWEPEQVEERPAGRRHAEARSSLFWGKDPRCGKRGESGRDGAGGEGSGWAPVGSRARRGPLTGHVSARAGRGAVWPSSPPRLHVNGGGGGRRPPLEVTRGQRGRGSLWSCAAFRPLPRHSRVNWSQHVWIEGFISQHAQGCVLGRARPGPALACPLRPGQTPAALARQLLPEHRPP